MIAESGWREIAAALFAAGWGVIPVIALHGPQMVASGLGWRTALPGERPPSVRLFLFWRLIREAVNALLPVAQVGGEVVGARLMALPPPRGGGVPLGAASASVTVDLTLEMAAQVPFTLIGLGLLLAGHAAPELAAWVLRGLGAAVVVLAALIAAQRFGLLRVLEERLLRLAHRHGWQGVEAIKGLHAATVAVYRSPWRIIAGVLCHLASWLLGALEVWAAFWALGRPVNLEDALIVEALGQAFHSLGFAVPGALGVQEGGLILICGLLGIPAPIALELSLLKRVREVALGLPGLLVWHLCERTPRRSPRHSDAWTRTTKEEPGT